MQLKVNELIAAHKHADNSLIALERLSEEELRTLRDRFVQLEVLNPLLERRASERQGVTSVELASS